MSFFIKYKKFLIITVAIVLILTLFSGSSPEKTAKKFLEYTYSGDGKKCVSMMSDELITKLQNSSNLETKKLVINRMQEGLDDKIETYKKKYGKKWKYDIEIIDCYEKDGITEVAYKVNFKGKGLFKKKDGDAQGKLKLIKSGTKWYINDL